MRTAQWREAAKHPVLVDAVLAAVLSAAVLRGALSEPGKPLAETASVKDVVVALVAFLAVLARRTHPRLALLVAIGATTAAVAQHVSNPGLIVVMGVITYSIAAHTDRRNGFLCALLTAVVIYLAAVIVGHIWWRPDALSVTAWVFMAAAVGDATRSHRAYIAEVEERARRAEQTREEEADRRVMQERLRIARELHDVVAHHIAVISVQAGAATHVLERRPDQVGPVLAHIREASDIVLKEISSVVGVLRNPGDQINTEPAPGVVRLPELVTALQAAGFEVRHQQRGDTRELPAVVDLAAYRIVQEALTNAHKYGDGSARLVIEYAPSGVILEINNAVRAGELGSGTGYGLLGMRERAASAGGTVTAGLGDDHRFHVHAVLPTGPEPAIAGWCGP
jgi:signal transduction histidine kinase